MIAPIRCTPSKSTDIPATDHTDHAAIKPDLSCDLCARSAQDLLRPI